MIKTIVVPVDGSRIAERALEPAAWLSKSLDDDLRIVMSSFAANTSGEEAILRRAAEQVPGADAHTEVLEDQFADRGIVAMVESAPDAALCMSTRGRGGFAESLLGSVSNEVLRTVFVPVVLVGPAYRGLPAEPRDMIVCIDGSEASSNIVPVAVEWARDLGLRAHVVTVANGRDGSEQVAAAGRTEDAAAALRAHGVPTTVETRHGSNAAAEVTALATEIDAALIAVSTHGHSGYSPRALGHVVTDIVRHSPCPVLVRRLRP